MMQWFRKEPGDQWRISARLREKVRFQVHDVNDQPPGIDRFDIVLCRNLLLYLTPRARARAFSRLREAVVPDGLLMLGAGETVIGQTDDFAADQELRGLYSPLKRPAPKGIGGAPRLRRANRA
jgi:chemotaxis protein methyltransferase CheR